MRGLILAKLACLLFCFVPGFFSVGFPLAVYLVSFNGEWKCKSRSKVLKWECICVYV